MIDKKYKEIPGYEGMYGISKEGEVKSFKRIRKQKYNTLSPVKERILKNAPIIKGETWKQGNKIN